MSTILLSRDQREALMREALAEAEIGLAEGEGPIGCVIVRLNHGQPTILARGHNRVQALGRKTAHAEMVAFENAAHQLPDEASHDLLLVSTLEPCVMCLGACMETGISWVVYGLEAPADNGTRRVRPPQSPDTTSPIVSGGVLVAESRALFERFVRGREGTAEAAYAEQLLALTR